MRKLIWQLLGLGCAVLLVAAATLIPALQRPYLDAFYARFTAPSAASLVLGTSRAAQAVLPAELRARLGQRYAGPWLNYAFTLYESPYGPAYVASVRRKLAPGTRRGLFVLTVDPWALSMPRPSRAGAPLVFPEDQLMIGQLHTVSQNPNLDYLAHFLHQPFYRVLLHDTTSLERLHPDGWLEIVLPPPSADTARLRQRIDQKLATYRPLAAASYLSSARLASLRQLIELLKPHGQVVVVRLPTGAALTALENSYQPAFEQLMQQTCAAQRVPYLSYTKPPYYPTNDGNHLWAGAARDFSQRLAEDITRLPASQ
jgi:hypothetical protein